MDELKVVIKMISLSLSPKTKKHYVDSRVYLLLQQDFSLGVVPYIFHWLVCILY